MTYTRKRPTGGYGKNAGGGLVPTTCADFIEFAKEHGFEVVKRRENVGEWNQCTCYYIEEKCVETVSKGGRGDWDGAIRDVQKMIQERDN